MHFPRDAANIYRHPTQIYYSVFAFVALIFLIILERRIIKLNLNKDKTDYRAVIAPLTLILYGVMRFSIDVLRDEVPGPSVPIINLGLSFNIIILLIALPFEIYWLVKSLKALKII